MRLIMFMLLTIAILQANMQMAPDGNFVDGTPQLAPDGTFVGSGDIQLTPNGDYIAVTPNKSNTDNQDSSNAYDDYYNNSQEEK